MSIPIHYNYKLHRLHVGFRAEDFEEVFVEAVEVDESSDEDDAPARGRRNQSKKKAERAGAEYHFITAHRDMVWGAPKESEILWLPHYDPKHFPPSRWADKLNAQKRMLGLAFDYLSERDPVKSKEMEQELCKPRSPRWWTWFEAAKTWKYKKFRRLEKSLQQAYDSGATLKEAREQLDWDSDDPGYESDGIPDDMPPPPRPNKRAANGTNRGKAKKQKPSNRARVNRSPSLFMNGALRDFDGRNVRGGAPFIEEDSEGGDSPMFDTRPPQASPSVLGGTGYGTPPPTNPRPNTQSTQRAFQATVRGESSEARFENGQDANGDADMNGENDWVETADYNGDIGDEEETVQRLVQESMPPEDRAQAGVDGARLTGNDNEVRESIEIDDNDA